MLNDTQTYGVGVAKAFVDEAKKQGIEIVGDEAWDAKQPNYTALFEGSRPRTPTASSSAASTTTTVSS